ncbi:uncharacterized protein [Acropora muricata]|uniref:uncharacterized protein n=1 Tax=Acropora muricata TaxID=159855 RepID=UPI0034E3ACDE
MAGLCSFSAVTSGTCGGSRGFTDCVDLNSCDGDISSHLQNHHLSRENVCEKDLILARAGLLELTDEQVKNMTVCPAHRFSLGNYWQAHKTCQYPKHHGKKATPVGSPICTTCRKKHSENVAQKTEWLYPKEPEDKTSLQRPAKEAAMKTIGLLVTSTPFRERPTPQNNPATPCWTPGTDAVSSTTPLVTDTVSTYNSAMDTIADLTAQKIKREPLNSQLKTPLKNLTKAEQLSVVQKASEDCLLVCRAIAPGSGEELFKSMAQSTQRETLDGSPPNDLVVLMTAYKNAKTKNLKRQILSLYAYRYPMGMLQKIHQPYGKLSTWEIKQARSRSHANLSAPGTTPEVTTKHRVRLGMSKVDHFVEFTNRPKQQQQQQRLYLNNREKGLCSPQLAELF